MIDFVLNRGDVAALADTQSKKPGQRRSHYNRVFALPAFYHPNDRVERVVEEMRIDLGLQSLQLVLTLLLVDLNVLRDKFLYLSDSDIEILREAVDLVGRVDGNVDVEIAAFDGLHRPTQHCDRPGDPHRDEIRNDD